MSSTFKINRALNLDQRRLFLRFFYTFSLDFKKSYMPSDTNSCPECGRPKKRWFPLCYDCSEKEKQRPRCEICGGNY